MKRIRVHNGQSIWDIAIQEYGAADGVYQLILDNPDKCNFETSLTPGVELFIDESMVLNQPVLDYFAKRKFTPANGLDILDDFNALLLADGSYFLFENGNKILLE